MARHAQTAAAVLGALSIEPMTGYEIRQAITSVLGHFWHESFGQIYPCLADLEEQGLVASTPGARPRSTTYVLTDAGRARLRELLEEPPTPQPPRNGVLLRVFFGASLPPEVLAAQLDELEADGAVEAGHVRGHPRGHRARGGQRRAPPLLARDHPRGRARLPGDPAVAGRDEGGPRATCYPVPIMTTALLLRCRDEA